MKLDIQVIEHIAYDVAKLYCQEENKGDSARLARKFAERYMVAKEALLELNRTTT